MRRVWLIAGGLLALGGSALAMDLVGVDNPLHGYHTTAPDDRFSRLLAKVEAGEVRLDTSGELALLRSLLQALEVPESSQMLVYSVTSLQKALISPRRPRALYFNDDTYVGYVPGGRLEIISLDPQLGSIFYIFDRLRPGSMPRAVRTEECMNCHAPRSLGEIPALVVESVVPGWTGGGEKAFRRDKSGHSIPLAERFGGYHLTGVSRSFPAPWANKLIDYRDGKAMEVPLGVGQYFPIGNYLRPTSHALPQLLQEHQVGFVNRALQAAYRTRELEAQVGLKPTERAREITQLAQEFTRYILFADEAKLVAGSIEADPEFREDFQANRKAGPGGASLKDLDGETRLLQYRCSYMVYSPVFAGLPVVLKAEVMRQLHAALREPGAAYAYLPAAERETILAVLQETLEGFRQAGS